MKSSLTTIWISALLLMAGAAVGFGQEQPSVQISPATSFETMPAGNLQRASDLSGTWSAEAGHAEITRAHHRSGQQSLRLFGGSMREILWTPEPISGGVDRLDLWFERWTSRPPFQFTIEGKFDDQWKILYQDSGKAQVGSFRHHLTLPLPQQAPTQVRFRSTSPAGSGVLIDDVSLVRDAPMQVKQVNVNYPVVPVLTGCRYNAVAEITIETDGNLEPLSIQQIELELGGTIAKSDIESIELLRSADGTKPNWNHPESVGPGLQIFGGAHPPSNELRFNGTSPLQPGTNTIYASILLRKDADPSHTTLLVCKSVTVAGKLYEAQYERPAAPLRIGHAIRQSQDDDVHTYRIPGLTTTNDGTLIAVYDIRHSNGGDLPGNIDVGMSRSTDGGKTWEPMQVILDMGENPKWRYDGVGDPAVLVDRNTGTIWVAGLWSHGNRAWHGSGPGLTPDETGQIVLTRSDDDGKTWSKPINITSQVKRKEWCLLLQGPGKGITMQDGTLVFASQFQDAKRLPHSAIIYSQDHGKTWHSSTAAWPDTTEAQVVEIEPGKLMLNCRYNRAGLRVVMTTTDMGKTWQEHPSSQKLLIEPGACMASLINVASETTGSPGPRLLFSNPDSRAARELITIKGSPDSGETWPQEYRVLLDEGRGAGYSCMTMIDDKTVGLLYEGSRSQLTFQRIPLQDIFAPKPPRKPTPEKTSLSLPKVFGDHMVLQANFPVTISGTAEPGVPVGVTLGADTIATTSDSNGSWSASLPARKASFEPLRLTVSAAGDSIEFNDVVVGEVWLCAGQSNMDWPLRSTHEGKAEIAITSQRTLRLLDLEDSAPGIPRANSHALNETLKVANFKQGTWARATSESAQKFSAVAWYFGRQLEQQLQVPVGLIDVSSGGSPTEAWIRRGCLEGSDELRPLVQGNWLNNPLLGDFCRQRGYDNLLTGMQNGEPIAGDDLGPNHPFKPGFLWDSAVAPIASFPFRGVLWYQGESNAETEARAVQHVPLLDALISDWREQLARPELPFLFVQLPVIERPAWPLFREGQRVVAERVPHCSMAVTVDTGERTNVHPAEKRPVGERLARLALSEVYSIDIGSDCTGPQLVDSVVSGNDLVLSFTHAKSGLTSSDAKPLRHFEVAGTDRRFYPATAKIEEDTIRLTSSQVTTPQFARYAWAPFPEPPVNFFNGEGLPASPFTTEPFPFAPTTSQP